MGASPSRITAYGLSLRQSTADATGWQMFLLGLKVLKKTDVISIT